MLANINVAVGTYTHKLEKIFQLQNEVGFSNDDGIFYQKVLCARRNQKNPTANSKKVDFFINNRG